MVGRQPFRTFAGMIWLIASILSSTAIMLLFRGFKTWKIPVFPAIVVNYAAAFGLGWFFFKDEFSPGDLFRLEWTQHLLVLGLVFLVIFNLMAKVAQKMGVSVSSIAAKMSMILPITVFLIIDPNDHLTWTKALGLGAAVLGVVLVSLKEDRKGGVLQLLGLPLLVLVGSGIIELVLGYYAESEFVDSDAAGFVLSSAPFMGAGIIGWSILAVQFGRGKGPKGVKWIGAGLVLGAVNFVSILALVKAIQSGILVKSALFPVNNVGIVVLSAAFSFLLFREGFSRQNIIGLLLGVLAIVLLAIP